MSEQRLPLIQSPLGEKGKSHPSVNEHAPIETRDETLFENPQFQHYEETTNIQLFFDLFFVANLTSFTNSHEVNSTSKLSSYIGFFCILWFTWCQVTLYDVRFATDSIIERAAHICHFGVMLGFAVVGPQFTDPKNETAWSTLQQLSLLLMFSRIVLFFQYGFTAFFAWRYRTTRRPLTLVMASLATAAILYLGLSFAFSRESAPNAYLAWYVVCVFEVGANIVIAGRWPVVSFRGTHLTERMTCLTLIILGEGVIGLTKSITKIEKLDYSFTSAAIGTLVSAGFVIYFIYQLYFDNVELEDFGIIRQQIWTFLHFPFHIALALLMEGANQFVSWRHIMEYLNSALAPVNNLTDSASLEDLYNALNTTVTTVMDNPSFSVTQDVYDSVIENLDMLLPDSNATEEQMGDAPTEILLEVFKTVFDGYGFEPPEIEGAEHETVDEVINRYYSVFELIFKYFFICAGLVLIFVSIFSWLTRGSNQRRSRLQYIGIVSNFLLGVGLTLLTTMVLTDSADTLGESAWTLPLLVFVLLIAMVLNHLPRYLVRVPKRDQDIEL